MSWPKAPTYWIEGTELNVSIPFTWNLPQVYARLQQREFFWDTALVGGPAVELMPGYFDDFSDFVTVGHEMSGVLQRINPAATRTTMGCPNKCKFCAVPTIEGAFIELDDWPDNPILCDNNLLKASGAHLDKVFDRLEKHEGVDFNQGLDTRLLNGYHIQRIKRLKNPKIRLACDNSAMVPRWTEAVENLLSSGVPKSWISSYVLIAYDSDPDECWARCEYVQNRALAYPQWYHALDCMEHNTVTPAQQALGWTAAARTGIMGYYYKHRGSIGEGSA